MRSEATTYNKETRSEATNPTQIAEKGGIRSLLRAPFAARAKPGGVPGRIPAPPKGDVERSEQERRGPEGEDPNVGRRRMSRVTPD